MRIVYRVFAVIVFGVILAGIIAYARGYRFSLETKSLTPTGILALSANPKPAKVYINGELKGVTDLNLTLPPGTYDIDIKKEGYTDYKKSLTLKGEIVTSLNALLFPKNPSLSPSSNLGVIKAVAVDQTDKVLLFSHNGDTEKDGVYLFDSNQRPLSFLPPLKPVVLESSLPAGVILDQTQVYFSPDYRQGVFDFKTDAETVHSYLLTLDQENTEPFDVTTSKDSIIAAWKVQRNKDIAKILETFPAGIEKVATDSFHIIAFSPDETKLLYRATRDVVLPPVITPALIGANQTAEHRGLEKGHFYVYDRKEDKNFEVNDIETSGNAMSPTPTPLVRTTVRPTIALARTQSNTVNSTNAAEITEPQLDIAPEGEYAVMWYPDSAHLVIQVEKEIVVVDYDGSNKRTVYSGPFEHGFFDATTNEKLFVLTNLNPQYNKYADLYEVGIR